VAELVRGEDAPLLCLLMVLTLVFFCSFWREREDTATDKKGGIK